ncbi:MAG TPA: M1 family aminopeptidase [Acidobacteriota bacterium]|nr:M1 family aminopeptidase [Acidobacteriota bacterium]
MRIHSIRIEALLIASIFSCISLAAAGVPEETDALAAYKTIHSFSLDGGSANVSNLTLKRDRAEMTFTGTFYFSKPVLGRVTGAVFIGEGKFHAEPPSSNFEKENLRRLLNADVVESDFKTAVLRFSDDSFSVIGQSHEPGGTAPKEAQDLASEMESRTARETGANLASRILVSILNAENPGVFVAQFDKGRRGRFTFVLDMQCRIPTVHFEINGGEKGLIFAYNKMYWTNDLWLAFYSEKDYQSKVISYSDVFDQVAVAHYDMKVDLRDPRKVLKVNAKMDLQTRAPVRAISFAISEGLTEEDSLRKKKGMHVTAARLADGTALQTIQDEWESGFVVLLPALHKDQEQFTLETEVEGDFIYDRGGTENLDCYYPFVNGEWYPRHGYLARSTFDITFLHKKKYKVAGPGERIREEAAVGNADEMVTTYRMTEPVALVTFAMGRFKIYEERRKLKSGELPIELFSPTDKEIALKEDFVLAEMGNAIDYLSAMFGKYPYADFRAVYHPFRYGQGFATLLALPAADFADAHTYRFISHETSHQWWGNIVSWRSYRDQWLSEGFAEYSGVLYTKNRTSKNSDVKDSINELRDSLKKPPETDMGIGSKRVVDIGPLILGHRLESKKSLNAYTTLIYNKGALVLRMLHFLFTDPSSGNGQAFFDMMKDFVDRYRNSAASTEQFAAVAGEHFARTPIAQKFGMKDLNWFFSQWVWQQSLPSYRFEYSIQDASDGGTLLQGTVFQENAPDNWGMPLPVVVKFPGDQVARIIVLAMGPQRAANIRLPRKPESVELDPDHWVLCDKASTKRK